LDQYTTLLDPYGQEFCNDETPFGSTPMALYVYPSSMVNISFTHELQRGEHI